MRPSNTLKLFSAKCFLNIFLTLMKIVFLTISRFFHNKLLVLSKNALSKNYTFKIECNKGPFPDLNLKTRFFEGKKRQSSQN